MTHLIDWFMVVGILRFISVRLIWKFITISLRIIISIGKEAVTVYIII